MELLGLFVAIVAVVFGSIGLFVWKDRSWTHWPMKPIPHQVTHYGNSFPELTGPRAEHVADTFVLLDEKGQQKGWFTVPVEALVPDLSLPPHSLKFVPGTKTRKNRLGGQVYYNYKYQWSDEEKTKKFFSGIIAS